LLTTVSLKTGTVDDNKTDMTSPRTLLRAWDVYPAKQMGQNFLVDPSTAEMIVQKAAIHPEETVLEIGAGLGALTIPTARAAGKVIAVEKDGRITGLLKTELLSNGLENVEILQQNILDVDIEKIGAGQKMVVIGNLPYNISSQILVLLIRSKKILSRAILMFQKEFCQRLMAHPGGREYGRITVMLRYCSEISRLAIVKPNMFFPRPRIDSEVIEVKFSDKPQYGNVSEDLLFLVIKSAFSKRRKTLKNSLSQGWLDIDANQAANMLAKAGINPSRRAETLDVDEFVKLTAAYKTLL